MGRSKEVLCGWRGVVDLKAGRGDAAFSQADLGCWQLLSPLVSSGVLLALQSGAEEGAEQEGGMLTQG